MGACKICKICQPNRLSTPLRGRPANDNLRQVRLAAPWEVLRRSHYLRLAARTATAMKALGLSRRRFIDYVAAVIVGFEGTIRLANGQVFEVPANFLDNAFGKSDASSDGRWISSWIRNRHAPMRQRRTRKLATRLICIQLALDIDRGHIDFHRRDRAAHYLRRREARKAK